MRTSRTIQRIAYDRWVRALGLLWLMAACGPSGLTIEVIVDDPAMVKVELYAGSDCGSQCPRITVPPGLTAMTVDNGFLIDDPRPFVVDKPDFSNGVAGFRLEAEQDTALAILVVVGYDAQNQIKWSWSRHYVEIPVGDSAHWKIKLEPTSAIGATVGPQPAGTERAAQWKNPSGGPACLLLEHWGENFVPDRDLLGPAGDSDCDGVAAVNECAPWIPNANGAAPTLAEASCLTTTVHAGSTTVCTIGGRECNEDPMQPRAECVSVDPTYCTPYSLCGCAGQLDQLACIREQIVGGTNMSTMPSVKCAIHVDANGNQCDAADLEIDLGAVLSGSSRKCTAIRVNDSDRELQFGQGLHLGDGKLWFESFEQPCKANVIWEGGMAPIVNYSLLETELDNGFHLVMPLRVDLKPGCADAAPSACTFEGNTTYETMFACVDAAPTMGACAPQPDALCSEGPMCNGQCCGSGEACGPNGCTCGGGTRCGAGDTCQIGSPNEDSCGAVCCGGPTLCPF
jgi:hypothetical protein